MPSHAGPNTAGESNIVFSYDTGDTSNSYRGEPTTNLLPNGVAEGHNSGAYGNVVTVTDATIEKGPGWKKVTISNRGSNFRIIQWTYLAMSANINYCFSATFDWGNMRDKGYFIYFDGDGTGGRTYYKPGDYVNGFGGSIDSNLPDGKLAGKIIHTGTHTHSFFIGNYSTGVSGLNDYFYYKEFQAETNSHPTPFTTGTRSATQGLLPLLGNASLDISTVSFDSNAQMTFDGTDDYVQSSFSNFNTPNGSIECLVSPETGAGSDQMVLNVGSTNTFGASRILRILDGYWSFATYGSTNQDWNTIAPVSYNVWNHIVMSWQGTTLAMYVNTIPYSAIRSGVVTPSGTLLRVGAAVWNLERYFKGKTSIVKIYNTALTTDQVKQNYQQYKTRFNLS